MLNKISNILALLFLVTSCKSQSITKNNKVVVTIKDSVVCDNKTIRIYELPQISLHNKKNTKKINDELLSDIKEHLNWFDAFKETMSLSNNLKQFVNNSEKECNQNLPPLESTSYIIGYNENRTILSLKLSIEVFAGNLTNYEYFYNYDLKKGKQLVGKNIFKHSKKLNTLINKKIKEKLTYELEDFSSEERKKIIEENLFKENTPKWFFINKQSNELGIEVLIRNTWSNLNMSSVMGMFFSFKELEPYLNEDFKKQITK